MIKMLLFFLLFPVLLVATATSHAPVVSALSCAQPDPAEKLEPLEHLQQSTYVFVGRPISTEKVDASGELSSISEYHQVFVVDDWIKGGRSGEVLIRADSTWSAPLRENASYLMVYNTSVEDRDGQTVDESRREFFTPLCPGANEQIIAAGDEYNSYASVYDQVREDIGVSLQPSPVAPQSDSNTFLPLILILTLTLLLGALF